MDRPQRSQASVDPAEVAQAFSGPVFRALSAAHWTPQMRRVEPLLRNAGDSIHTLADAFEHGHTVMAQHYRGEYYFKNEIINKLIFGRHSPRTASAIMELPAGRSIADVVVFNGTSTAYEIKTDRDSFERLESQLQDYSEAFAHVYVVTSIERSKSAERILPSHVGILGLRKNGRLSEVRPADEDLARLSCERLAAILRQDELLQILRRTLEYERDTTPARLRNRTTALFCSLPIEVAQAEAVRELRQRGCQRAPVASVVPKSLRALAYAVPLSQPATERMARTLAQPVTEIEVG